MPELYKVDSPITREQRNNLNATFQDILNRFTNLRYQISILAGGEDLEVILQRIEDAVTNANNTTADTQQVLNDISDALNQLSTALQNSDNAADNANDAATNAQNEISNMQNYVNQLGNAETYDNSKTYSKNNIAEYNGSSFIALRQTTGNAPPTLPTKRNDFWQLLAQRGVDGTGSVASVNNQSPDVNGNVQLTPGNIGAATETDLTNLSQSVSTLSTEVTKHLDDYVNVKSFGAVGDGVTDDTQAFIDAVAYQQLNGGILLIPNGTYILNTGFHCLNRIDILGIGKPTIKASNTFATSTLGIFRIDGNNSSIRNLSIDGNKSNVSEVIFGLVLYAVEGAIIENVNCTNTSGIGIGLSNCRNITLKDCTVQYAGGNQPGFWAGYDLGEQYKKAYIKYFNCHAMNNDLDGFLINVDNVTLESCVASQNGVNPPATSGALGGSGIYSDSLQNEILITNCIIENNTEFGINGVYSRTTICACTISNNSLSGINFRVGGFRNKVTNCTLEGNGTSTTTLFPEIWGKSGIQFDGNLFLVITGCISYDNKNYGIESMNQTRSDGVVIVGNNLKYNNTHDSNLETAYSPNIEGLIMESNY